MVNFLFAQLRDESDKWIVDYCLGVTSCWLLAHATEWGLLLGSVSAPAIYKHPPLSNLRGLWGLVLFMWGPPSQTVEN